MISLTQYHNLASRTFNKWPALEGNDNQLMYLAIGLAGECRELKEAYRKAGSSAYLLSNIDKFNTGVKDIVSELGDVNWHLIQLFGLLNNSIEEITTAPQRDFVSPLDSIEQMLDDSLIVLELMKKKIYHKHSISNSELFVHLKSLYNDSKQLAEYLCGDLWTVLNENVEKLRKRYPQGFSYEKSQNREDEKNEQNRG